MLHDMNKWALYIKNTGEYLHGHGWVACAAYVVTGVIITWVLGRFFRDILEKKRYQNKCYS